MARSLHLTICFAIVLACSLTAAADAGSPYRVTDFGAAGDGQALDTAAIQAAIDHAAGAGGGTVFFPAGRYLSGTLFMKSHVHLHLDAGATLLGSPNLEDYPAIMNGHPSRADSYCARALIRGEGLEDIGITGRGTIDGQGALFRDNLASAEELAAIAPAYEAAGRYVPKDVYLNRPYILQLVSCRQVVVEGIRMRNSAMWMQHYLDCDFVTIRGIDVYNHGCRNNDMIDIDGCRNVTITDCIGDTDDDALTLKSTGPRPTEHVLITNCILRSRCNAIKAGTESAGGFRNIAISNCVVETSSQPEGLTGRPEGLAGIALEIVDGGVMEGVAISNIVIRGTTAPIFIRLGDRARPPQPNLPPPAIGVIRDVILSNITARDASNVGCAIAGLPGHPIENLTLSNIRLGFAGGGTAEQVAAEVPENEKQYPESTMFGPLPAYGLYLRHATGVTLDNLELRHASEDARPALVCDDIQRLQVDGFQSDAAPGSPQISLVRTRDAQIRGAVAEAEADFLRIGPECGDITVTGSDLSRARQAFLPDQVESGSILHAFGNRMPGGP
jgi:polygalacturonase